MPATRAASAPVERPGVGVVALDSAPPLVRHARHEATLRSRRRAASAQRAEEERMVQELCDRRHAHLRPLSLPPAADRFEALRQRVRARAASTC